MIENVWRNSPAGRNNRGYDALEKAEIINIVAKALVQDIAWEIEAGGNDCFIGVADNSRFQLSNWQLTTRGDRYSSQSFSWSGGEFDPTL